MCSRRMNKRQTLVPRTGGHIGPPLRMQSQNGRRGVSHTSVHGSTAMFVIPRNGSMQLTPTSEGPEVVSGLYMFTSEFHKVVSDIDRVVSEFHGVVSESFKVASDIDRVVSEFHKVVSEIVPVVSEKPKKAKISYCSHQCSVSSTSRSFCLALWRCRGRRRRILSFCRCPRLCGIPRLRRMP